MRKIKYTLILILAAVVVANAQSRRAPQISNVKLEVEDEKIIVNYDIENSSPNETYEIGLNFLNKDFDMAFPENVFGDIGKDVKGGTGKRIVWNVALDREQLQYELSPNIYLDGVGMLHPEGAGPESFMYSLLLPGLGDYFVAETRKMKFKPYMRTVLALGSVGLGVWLTTQKTDNYRWIEPYYKQTWSGLQYIEGHYVPDGYKYKWFSHDNLVFLGIGAAIWIYDVAWVIAKGTINNRLQKTVNHFSLGPNANGGMNISYKVKF